MSIKRRLQAIADGQKGYFTTQQALHAGYTKPLYDYHIRNGNWLRVDRALFRLSGYSDSQESLHIRWSLWASKRHGGRGVCVGYDSALYYYGLQTEIPEQVHLIVPPLQQPRTDKSGCVFHRQELGWNDFHQKQGFNITTPYRTLLDMKPDLLLARKWADTIRLAENNHLIGAEIATALLSERSTSVSCMKTSKRSTDMTDNDDQMSTKYHVAPRESISTLYLSSKSITRQIRHRTGQGAFTLVELLTVVAVISILAGILLPCLSTAWKQAVALRCLANLRQISLATHTYSSDHNGYMLPAYIGDTGNVSTNWWIYRVVPYLNTGTVGAEGIVLRCPAWERFPGNLRFYSYAISRYLGYIDSGGQGQYRYPGRIERISRPADKFHLADGNLIQEENRWAWRFFANPDASGRVVDTMRHANRANLLFGDGHGSSTNLPAQIDQTQTPELFERHYIWE